MKRLFFILIVTGLGLSTTALGMSKGQVRKETRFLTDKMAYELSLSTRQYDDVYEINYDFIYAVRHIMDEVVRGYEWAVDAYYDALDIRNDDLRWVLSERQYRRFVGMDYFCRPIYVRKGDWSFRIYIHYPDRGKFFFGIPHHYHTYCGAHYRTHIHHVSYYKGRYASLHHCSASHQVRNNRVYHSYRRSDFGTVRFRPHSSQRPHRASVHSSVTARPPVTVRENTSKRSDRIQNRPAANKQTVSHRRSSESSTRRNSVAAERDNKQSASKSVRRSQKGTSRSSEREKKTRLRELTYSLQL